RRKFLERVGLTTAGVGLSLFPDAAEAYTAIASLPKRTLGRTNAKVSILAFGCGSRFLMYEDEEKAIAALNHAIDLGITYLDTAYAYGDGKSESRVGKVTATRRKDVWMATKIPDRTRDAFLRRLESSLTRLQTDHVDLVHIHSLGQAEDLEKIEAPDGALKGLLEAREQKLARFIGVTSHTNGEILATAIQRHDLDCVQMALNASRNGRFEELALPAANAKNLGIIAMKVTGQEFLLGNAAGKADKKFLAGDLHGDNAEILGIGGRKRELFKAAVARCVQRHLHAIEIVALNGRGKDFAICVAGHADEAREFLLASLQQALERAIGVFDFFEILGLAEAVDVHKIHVIGLQAR